VRKNILKEILAWWHTDCRFCQKARLMITWLLLMLIADYFWFKLLF